MTTNHYDNLYLTYFEFDFAYDDTYDFYHHDHYDFEDESASDDFDDDYDLYSSGSS